MNNQKASNQKRLRRKRHIRKNVHGGAERPRLSVFRSNKHIYCQVVDDFQGKTLASASTLVKDVQSDLGGSGGGNKAAAAKVGKLIAERAKAAGIAKVVFDRNGYKFHGRVKELAQAARENGLSF